MNLDLIPEKVWAVCAALISALGGFVIYERKRVDGRIDKIEHEVSQHKTDVAVLQAVLLNLKEDTQEIKELLENLTIRRRK